jgi:hypothetical protein
MKKTRRRIELAKLEEAQLTSLLQTAKSLFSNCPNTWPLHYSFYYLGHVPKLNSHVDPDIFMNRLARERFLHNVSGDWHMSSIRLASRIWGRVQKEMAKRRDLEKRRH